MFSLASTPQDLGGILQQGILLGRGTFRRVFMLATFLALTGLARNAFLVWGAGDATIDPDFMMHRLGDTRAFAVVALAAVALFFYALIYKRIDNAAQGRVADLATELREALRVWPWLVLAGILYACSVLLGLVLLIVPGVILLLSLMFWDFGVVLDSRRPVDALNASHNLVWGHWWRTLGLMLLVFLPLQVLETVVASLLGLDPGSTQDPWPTGRVLFQHAVLDMVFTAGFGPFVYSILYVYYRDLKLRKPDV